MRFVSSTRNVPRIWRGPSIAVAISIQNSKSDVTTRRRLLEPLCISRALLLLARVAVRVNTADALSHREGAYYEISIITIKITRAG